MKSLARILLMSLVLGLFCGAAGTARSAFAAEPYAMSYTYRLPVTVYRPPVIVYRPAEVVYAPVPMVYKPPTTTVVYYRGPLGLFPRRAVYHSPGADYAPAPVVVLPAPAVIYPAWELRCATSFVTMTIGDGAIVASNAIKNCSSLVVICSFLIGSYLAVADEPSAEQRRFFESEIRPLLVEHCVKCHGPKKQESGLRLDSRERLLRGGETGPAVMPGKPQDSLLVNAVRQTGELKMPPKGKLNKRQIAALVKWIESGVPWPKYADAKPGLGGAQFSDEQKSYWAFQPVSDPAIPTVRDVDWPSTPMDYFVLAKLEDAGLTPAAPADRRVLIRRVTCDLTGLPPTPDEVHAFQHDTSPDAYDRLVDRLLASPAYGERWGRRWLDVVRYAETTANDGNFVMRYAWRYRDYVINSFNTDKPYDQFVVEQMAGDLPSNAKAEQVIATGFLMIGPKALAETDKEQTMMDIVDEQIDVTGRAFLGLTVACARCHDHKFDPIPTVDYYSLAGIFRSTEVLADRNRNATMWHEFEVDGDGGKVTVMAPKEFPSPKDLQVHIRGNRFRLGTLAPRRFLQIVAGEGHPPIETRHSGRLELGRWIAEPKNPLTARVMVNRIWQGHFGRGIVSTSDNFGRMGSPPSHPRLLDWLASQFVKSGWSVKSMHRQMVLSSTYRQASAVRKKPSEIDPDNLFIWHVPRRRLEAEELRDSLLEISGRLDRHMGDGDLSMQVYNQGEILDKKRGISSASTVKNDDPVFDTPRRTVYLPVIRNGLPDSLALFDAADPNQVTASRSESTASSQALFLLNSPFVRAQARHFANALLNTTDADVDRIRTAHVTVLGRLPDEQEINEAEEYLREFTKQVEAAGVASAEARLAAWQSYCQLMFCLNEFLYVE